MKRDMDLVRKILFKIEEIHEDVVLDNSDMNIEGYTEKEVAYHCSILHEANYLKAYGAFFAGDELYAFQVGGLTWDGCEFLDKIRSETVWNKTKDTITTKGLPMALDVVKDVSSGIVSALVKSAIG